MSAFVVRKRVPEAVANLSRFMRCKHIFSWFALACFPAKPVKQCPHFSGWWSSSSIRNLVRASHNTKGIRAQVFLCILSSSLHQSQRVVPTAWPSGVGKSDKHAFRLRTVGTAACV